MYLPKGTTIYYRIVLIKNDKGEEKEMIMIDKDIFESIVTTLDFEKKEQTKEKIEG